MIFTTPLRYDTINRFVLALNAVYLVAVAMMTLQHITVVLQQKVLCEQGVGEKERQRGLRRWANKMRTATIKRRATFTKLFVSHDTRSAT